MLRSIGVLGFLSIAIFLGWFVGWLFLGRHTGWFHWLVLAAVLLFVTQLCIRVADPKTR